MTGTKRQLVNLAIAAAGIVAVFLLLGLVTYDGIQRHSERVGEPVTRSGNDDWLPFAQRHFEDLQQRLELTPDQAERVREIVMRRPFGPSRQGYEWMLRERRRAIREVLTPDQEKIYEEMMNEFSTVRGFRGIGPRGPRPN